MSNRFGILPLKRSSFRERVVANREQEVRPQLGPVDRLRKLGVEGSGAALVVVVEEVLLELVEDDEQLATHLRAPVIEHLRERRAGGRLGEIVALEQRRHLGACGGGDRLSTDRDLPSARTTITAKPAASSSARFSRDLARSWLTTPARRTELLPTPLGPYRSVSRAARRFAAMISASASRPKKNGASASL